MSYYYKTPKHYQEVKRCPECHSNSMRFINHIESWVCSACNNVVREDFFQTVLPSSKEIESDEIQADNSQSNQQHERLYIKPIRQGSNEQDYEASVKMGPLNAGDNENKYHGSAQSALRQDAIKFGDELRRNARIARQLRGQFSGTSQDQDSQESLIDKHRYRKLREQEDRL